MGPPLAPPGVARLVRGGHTCLGHRRQRVHAGRPPVQGPLRQDEGPRQAALPVPAGYERDRPRGEAGHARARVIGGSPPLLPRRAPAGPRPPPLLRRRSANLLAEQRLGSGVSCPKLGRRGLGLVKGAGACRPSGSWLRLRCVRGAGSER
eukprot:11964701-Alexandrium_andersonii.AAC.1